MNVPRESYSGSATMRTARAQYFETFHLDAGGYTKRWVSLKAGPIPFGFPNSQARVRALRFHDLHHVLTGYRADWFGECEIAAWEIGSGMGSFWTGFAINAGAFVIGLVLCPRRAFRAWLRGRRSGNLYRGERIWSEALLDETVDAQRARIGIGDETAASFADVASYVALASILLAPLVALAVAVLWSAH
jgi:hypothetical protein